MEKILRKAGAILITFLSICVMAVTFMNFITIDVSGGSSTMETILSWAGIDKNISLTGQDLFYWGLHMNGTIEDINENVAAGLHKLAFLFIIPFIILLITVLFAWIGKMWSWVVSAVTALGGGILFLAHPLWIAPHNIAVAVDSYMETGTTGKIVDSIKGIGKFIEEYTGTDLGLDNSIDVEAVLKDWLFSSLDTGYWVCFGLFAVIFVVAVLSLVFCIIGRKKMPVSVSVATFGETVDNVRPTLCCKFGDLKDMEIDLSSGGDILIGNDVSRCSVIDRGPDSEPVWCMLHYDREYNRYRIVDVSTQNIYLSSEEHSWWTPEKGKMTEIPRNSEIRLGNTGKIIALS